jgi:hypothetical protein
VVDPEDEIDLVARHQDKNQTANYLLGAKRNGDRPRYARFPVLSLTVSPTKTCRVCRFPICAKADYSCAIATFNSGICSDKIQDCPRAWWRIMMFGPFAE